MKSAVFLIGGQIISKLSQNHAGLPNLIPQTITADCSLSDWLFLYTIKALFITVYEISSIFPINKTVLQTIFV